MKKSELPISPHLQIYKPQITSILSITHRITGVCLNFLILFVSLWLLSLSLGENIYNYFIEFSNTIFMKLVMSISIFGLSYHAMNGIRHILWDFGFFLNNLSGLISGIIVILSALVLSILLIFKLGIIS
ncbi:MAG: succinate dehydrogenase, cytochrome b556 subunit [Rickettsiales bacterium]|nr:succinate dehydrogenase, cytochrome b556 subunit [Rickettsiales bacterium]RPG15641.1 MAG: succinate dehydrogenase, cytochrome b556 subunit [Pelagibacteraceae bacterium TMED195]|tara:strand:+ start:2103 stop:2489 length:387 start_codon:yes stop_codon:yes gene_type:complete